MLRGFIGLCVFVFVLFALEKNLHFGDKIEFLRRSYAIVGGYRTVVEASRHSTFLRTAEANYFFRNGISKQAVDTILQQAVNFEKIVNSIEPIDTIQFTMYRSKQLTDAWGKGSVETFQNKEHACPYVQKCFSVVGDLSQDKSLSRSRALVNMVSNCQNIENGLSKSFMEGDTFYFPGKNLRKVLLCGEGGRKALEGKLENFDIAFLFNPMVPYTTTQGAVQQTELLFFNPHVRGGVSFFLKLARTARNPKPRIQLGAHRFDVGIFVSNCEGGPRNRYLSALTEPSALKTLSVFSFGKCFPVHGRGRTNVQEFLRMNVADDTMDGGGNPFKEKEYASRSFRFIVSMENAVDNPFYVTEKIFNAYRSGALPLYLGPREVLLFVPKHSFIDVSNYRDTPALVKYLEYLKKNRSAYDEYMSWDLDEYVSRPWIQSKLLSTSWQCRLCSQLSSL